jgi:hypothetical protein
MQFVHPGGDRQLLHLHALDAIFIPLEPMLDRGEYLNPKWNDS